MSALLDGVRVLELTDRLGAGCGAFLASLGADVLKIEWEAWDRSRQLADGEEDPSWLPRNLGKRIVRLDPDNADERRRIHALAAAADIFVESLPPHWPATKALDYASLAAVNPGLVQVSITAFGQSGPYARWAGDELVCSALGGALAVTGYEDRAPVKEAGDACVFHAAGVAAAGALFALTERRASGFGQHVDVSVQEVTAGRCTNGVLAWQFDQRLLQRSGAHISYGQARVRTIWELADGYCFHGLMSGRIGAPANAALSAWMDEAGFDNPMRGVDWLAYNRSTLPADTRAAWEAAMDRFFRSRTKAEIASEGRRRGINAVPANAPADVLADPHLAARAFFADIGDGRRAPGRFVRIDDETRAPKPPVTISADEALAAWPRRPPSRAPAKASSARPLDGLKVLDFSWALVGSFTTKALADFGATVVKVESSNRPCLSRIDVQVAASKPGNFDDKPWFIHMNTSKLGLRLNMKHPRWREVVGPLLDWADVVVENFSPGTMAGFGLDYETLKARRPDLIMLSGSIYGQTGPLAREWGVDGTGAALSGRLALTGWPDRPPVTPSAVPYGDVVMPPYMVAALAAALERRERTGEGCRIDAAMYEVCVQQMAGAILAAQSGEAPRRLGNRDPAVLVQGVYPTLGEDRWIAISAADGRLWEKLRAAMDWRDGPAAAAIVSGDPALLDAIDARIAAWTRGQDGYVLMAALQALGVPTGVVQDAADLIDRDPQLQGRGFLVPLDNPALGRFGHQGEPAKLSRTPARLATAPGLGEHTEPVCRQFAGLSAADYADLAASGLFE